jgi:hypothetical protein
MYTFALAMLFCTYVGLDQVVEAPSLKSFFCMIQVLPFVVFTVRVKACSFLDCEVFYSIDFAEVGLI